MSVRMTLTVTADPKQLEQFLIAHRFFGSDDGGSLMVLDEWPDRQSFESFFHEQESEIGPMFVSAGVTAQPEPMFWRELETHDAYGWGA